MIRNLKMEKWKQRLYDSYVSTGQAARDITPKEKLDAGVYSSCRNFIRELIPANKEISIVDLGCGHGALLRWLKTMGYKNVAGVDVSPEQVALAHKLGIGEIECANIFEYLQNKKRTFDVVLLMDVLEHLNKEELLNLMDKVYLAIKEGGMMIIQIPNAEGLFGMRIRYGDLTHETCFTPRSIEQILRAVAFREVRISEQVPVVHGIKSFIRYILWHLLTILPRLLLTVETGSTRNILSQNMLVSAKK